MVQGTRAKTISFMSAKGGVGKTSIAVNVANFCSYYKMRVLLVDCDLRTRGATHFLGISTISLKEGSFITLNHIIDDILNQKIINSENAESNKGRENADLPKHAKDELPVLTAKSFKFIPASLQPYGFTSTFSFHDSEKNTIDKSNNNSESVSYKGSLDDFEIKLRNQFKAYQQRYELILLDLGAGDDNLNLILSKMSDCICIVAGDNKVSENSVRDLVDSLRDNYRSRKIKPCYNLISEKNRNCQYNKSLLQDQIRGFEYMADYAELFDNGEMLNPEDNRYAEPLLTIINGLGVDSAKIMKEIQKARDAKEALEEKKRQEEEKRLKVQKRKEEKKQEEQRKREEQERQEEERRQEEQRKREIRENWLKTEYKRIYRWDFVICAGILFSMFLVASLFAFYWNRIPVWIYGLMNIVFVIFLIIGFNWLNFFKKKMEKSLKYADFYTEKGGGKTNDAGQQ